jgi:hypothetical protein
VYSFFSRVKRWAPFGAANRRYSSAIIQTNNFRKSH